MNTPKIYTDEELADLSERERQAHVTFKAAQHTFDRNHAELHERYVRPAEIRLHQELLPVRKVRDEAWEKHRELERELQAARSARDAHDREQKVLNHPMLGKTLVFWESPRYGTPRRWHRSQPLVRGIVEIFKDGDDLPSNVRWNTPHSGTLVIRLLKAGGDRSKRVEKFGYRGELPFGWFEEGVDPNTLPQEGSK